MTVLLQPITQNHLAQGVAGRYRAGLHPTQGYRSHDDTPCRLRQSVHTTAVHRSVWKTHSFAAKWGARVGFPTLASLLLVAKPVCPALAGQHQLGAHHLYRDSVVP